MGLQSAMTTALTGLQAAETTIDVVGNNVANSNTAGFKESNVLFATQFLQTQSIGSAPSTSSGGTNPRQIGLGVSVAEIAPNFTQGTIQVSANPLDLAIQGDGFFILQGPNGGVAAVLHAQRSVQDERRQSARLDFGQSRAGLRRERPVRRRYEHSEAADDSVRRLGRCAGNEQCDARRQLAAERQEFSTKPGIIDSVILNDNSIEKPTTTPTIHQLSPPIPGTATANAPGSGGGATGLEAGTYNYKIAFVDPNAPAGHNEGPRVDRVRTGHDRRNAIGQLLRRSLRRRISAVYTKMNIYRADGSGTYKLVSRNKCGRHRYDHLYRRREQHVADDHSRTTKAWT